MKSFKELLTESNKKDKRLKKLIDELGKYNQKVDKKNQITREQAICLAQKITPASYLFDLFKEGSEDIPKLVKEYCK